MPLLLAALLCLMLIGLWFSCDRLLEHRMSVHRRLDDEPAAARVREHRLALGSVTVLVIMAVLALAFVVDAIMSVI